MPPAPAEFLIPMAIGDAFGMKYEFVDHAIPIAAQDLTYGIRPKYVEYQRAHYSDDTQKCLGNAELLLKKTPASITREDFARTWLEVFHRDPRPGYSKHMYRVLSSSVRPENFFANLDSSRGTTSGAAMAAAVFGLLPDLQSVKDITRLQASITHNTTTGIHSALAVAVAAHFLHHGGDAKYLEPFLAQTLGAHWCSAETGLTDDPKNGLNIVRQALNALQGATRFSEVMIAGASQARIADTDTICAVAMALASRRADMKDDLPPNLRHELENDQFGSTYLKMIDRQLLNKFPRSDRYAAFTM